MAEEEKKPLPIAEIVTGLIMAAIIIVFAVPRYVSHEEKGAIGDDASNLFYDLHRAKNRALETKTRAWVVFDTNTTYTVFLDSNNNGEADSGEVMKSGKLSTGVEFGANIDPPLANVWGTANTKQGIDLDNGSRKFYFDSKGKANPGGAVYFINQVDVGVTNNNARAVKILGTTGEISMVKPAPGESPPWK